MVEAGVTRVKSKEGEEKKFSKFIKRSIMGETPMQQSVPSRMWECHIYTERNAESTIKWEELPEANLEAMKR